MSDENADRIPGLVMEVVTLNVMHLKRAISDDEFEESIRTVSAEVRESPAMLIAYLGRFSAAVLFGMAKDREQDPMQLLREQGAILMADPDE